MVWSPLAGAKGSRFGPYSNFFGLVGRGMAPLGARAAFHRQWIQCGNIIFYYIWILHVHGIK
jgi:hypothetical protein